MTLHVSDGLFVHHQEFEIVHILFWNDTTCFGRSFRPSSGVRDCTYFILELHYMFRTVFSSIIRSSRLYIQQQAFVKLKFQGRVKLLVKVYVCFNKSVNRNADKTLCNIKVKVKTLK